MKLTPKQRAEVYAMFGGHCAYCGIVLPEKGWHADHVEPLIRISVWKRSTEGKPGRFVQTGRSHNPEATSVDDFFPSCAPCNINKGPTKLEDWREWLNHRIIEGLRRNSSTFRHAERFGRVTIATEPLVFYFEKREA